MDDERNDRVSSHMNHDQIASDFCKILALEDLHGKSNTNRSLETCKCQQQDLFPVDPLAQIAKVADKDANR
jgi:hypothetical protein